MEKTENSLKSSVEEIFDRIIWQDKIKGNCFLCGGSIPKTWEHYFTMGNSCGICSAWAGMSQQARRECRIKDIVAWRALTNAQRNEEKIRIQRIIQRVRK